MEPSKSPLERVLTSDSLTDRRDAFNELLTADVWDQVLVPDAIAKLGYSVQGGYYPDRMAMDQAAAIISSNEEQIHHCLTLLDEVFVDELVLSLAIHMKTDFVEHALDHLRTAEGHRAEMLESILHRADPDWVKDSAARRTIRRRLRTRDSSRLNLMTWLGDAGNIGDFLEVIEEHLPTHREEWSALGRAGVSSPALLDHALASLVDGSESVAFLLRLDPVPEKVVAWIMAAAQMDWLFSALEVAIMEELYHPHLVGLAELAVRLGGVHQSVASSWIGSVNLGPRLLGMLGKKLERGEGRSRVSSGLWVKNRPVSAHRALEAGRKGEVPEPLDAAALIRQVQGPQMLELVEEILGEPRPEMMENILHPLVALNPEAAQKVQNLSKSLDPNMAGLAREACEWSDVRWPEPPEEAEDELPATFTPLGKGI